MAGGQSSWRDKNPPKRTGWKGKSSTGDEQRLHGWEKQPRDGELDARNRVRRYKIALSTACIIGLIGVFLWYVIRFPRPTPFVMAAIVDYPSPIPPNAFAQEDIEQFQSRWPEIAENKQGHVHRRGDKVNWQTSADALKDFAEKLQDIKPGGPDKNVVLIYLSAHGMLNPKGEPCLMLKPDAEWAGPDRADIPCVLLSDLLETVQHAFKDYPHAKKLVILDCNRIDADWKLGILRNGFADGLDKVVRAVNDGHANLVVFNSTAPGQVGWASPESLRGSVFAHFVLLGLSGEASNGSTTVSLTQLRDYVKKEVNRWVRDRYQDVQTPMLFPEGAENFNLTSAEGNPGEAAPQDASRDWNEEAQIWNGEVKDLWSRHEQLANKWTGSLAQNSSNLCDSSKDRGEAGHSDAGSQEAVVHRQEHYNLVVWEAFQQKLLRLEEVLNAGKASKGERDNLLRSLPAFADQMDAAGATSAFAAYSLPLEADPIAPTPKDLDRVKAALKQNDDMSLAAVDGVRRMDRLRIVWNWLLERGDRFQMSQDIAMALKVVDRPEAKSGSDAEAAPGPEPVELRFLRLLSSAEQQHALVDDDRKSVLAALHCRDLAEKAASSGADERTQYLVRAKIEQADEERRQSEDYLFVDGGNDLEQAKLPAEYQDIRERERKLADAFRIRDRGFLELPYFAHWLQRCRDPEQVDLVELRDACVEAINDNHLLADKLDEAVHDAGEPTNAPAQSDPDPGHVKLFQAACKVEQGLDKLKDEFEKSRTDADVSTKLRTITNLMSVPHLLTGDRRNELRSDWLTFLKSAAKNSQRDDGTKTDNSVAAADGKGLPALQPHWTPWQNPHPAMALLGLESSPVKDAPTAQATGDGAKVHERLLEVRERLEGSETKGIASEAAAADPRVSRSASDQLARSASALLTLPDDYDRAKIAFHDPIGGLQRFDLHELLVWHGRRAVDDFWGNGGAEGDKSYFDFLANAYLASARSLNSGGNEASLKNKAEEDLDRRIAERAQSAEHLMSIDVKSRDLSTSAEDLKLAKTAPDFKTPFAISPDPKWPAGTPAPPAGTISVFPLYAAEGKLDPDRLASWKTKEDDKYTQRQGWPTSSLFAVDHSAADRPPGDSPDRIFQVPKDLVPRADSQWNWKVVAWYRGHVASKAFRVSIIGPGREIVYVKPKSPRAPSIKVIGETEDPGAVAFILDCSGSMSTVVDKRSGATRMDKAKEALETILPEMAKAGKYRVSFWLYGHRFGFDNKPKGPDIFKEEWNPAWPVDPSVEYATDVQPVWHSDRFDEAAKKELDETLAKAGPWGGTPLYLAIKRVAEDDLALQDPNRPRRLVVLTDGFDNVRAITPTGDSGLFKLSKPLENDPWLDKVMKYPSVRPLDQVVTVLRRNGPNSSPIQLSVLVCDFDATDEDDVNEKPRFEELIKRVGGKKYDVATGKGDDLKNDLEAAIGPTSFTVQRMDDNQFVGKQSLNKELVLPKPPLDGRVKYSVDVPQIEIVDEKVIRQNITANVAIQGEERLVLKVHRAGRDSLIHTRYDPDPDLRNPAYKVRDGVTNLQADAGADPDFNPARFYLAAHRPEPEVDADRNGYVFPISIQNWDPNHFSPRPAEAWVEITPVIDQGPDDPHKKGPYLFYDLEFEPDRPVPVLLCHAPGWPANADRAKIRVWFKLSKTEQAKDQRIGDVKMPDDRPSPQLDLTTPQGRKVRFGVRISSDNPGGARQIIVTEQHDAADTVPMPLKVELSEPADKIQHEYIQGGRTIRHTFTYEGRSESELEQVELRVTKFEDLQKDAVQLQEPLEVIVYRQ